MTQKPLNPVGILSNSPNWNNPYGVGGWERMPNANRNNPYGVGGWERMPNANWNNPYGVGGGLKDG